MDDGRRSDAAPVISTSAGVQVKETVRVFALFEHGFRPFFLRVGLHGALVIPVWVAVVLSWISLPVEMEVSWHAPLWVIGRVATTLSTVFSPPLAALLDLAFVPALASLVVRPLLAPESRATWRCWCLSRSSGSAIG